MGAMKMQLQSIQTAQDANRTIIATHLASELSEKMRSNHEQMQQMNSNPFLKVNFQSDRTPPKTSATCFHTNCNSEQLANSDISEWLQQVTTSLPNARAVVCYDDFPWDSNVSSFKWECASAGNHNNAIIKLGWGTRNNPGEKLPPRIVMAVTPSIN